ncbi:MAG: hypothetical protein ACRC7R_12270, partial [Sarcina sp.]
MNPLFQNEGFFRIENGLSNKTYPIEITGLSDSGKSYIIDGIYEKLNKPIIIVTHNDMEARNLYE